MINNTFDRVLATRLAKKCYCLVKIVSAIQLKYMAILMIRRKWINLVFGTRHKCLSTVLTIRPAWETG